MGYHSGLAAEQSSVVERGGADEEVQRKHKRCTVGRLLSKLVLLQVRMGREGRGANQVYCSPHLYCQGEEAPGTGSREERSDEAVQQGHEFCAERDCSSSLRC